MQWVQYAIMAVLLLFIVSRLMPVKGLVNLSSAELKDRIKDRKDHLFVDVREVNEYRQGHIRGFVNYPLSQLKTNADKLDRNKTIVLTCRSGMRSRQAAKILSKKGFAKLNHLKSGISGWDGGLTK